MLVFSSGASVQHFMAPDVERADFSAWPMSQRLSHLPPHFSSPFYATAKTNSAALPHTHHLCFFLFAFVQAVPFSHFLFILLFSLTFWSLLADMHSINYYMTMPPAWMRRAPSFHSTSAVLYSLYLLLSILSKCSVSCPGQFMSSWKANIVFIIYILSVLRDSFGQIVADTYYFWGGVKRRNGWVDGWCLKRKRNTVSLRRHSMSQSQTA